MTRLMIACLMVGIWNATLLAYSGGTGEPNDPYQIATAKDLIALGNEPNDYHDCFILTADIDLSGYVFDRALIAPDCGLFETEFIGFFDGQGYAICHLTIQGDSYLGLFGRLSESAVIINLGLEAVDVNGAGSFVGGLVGENSGMIVSSYCSGSLSGTLSVGGLVGGNDGGILTMCYSLGMVNGSCQIGGLVGVNSGGHITLSYCNGTVVGETGIGGLVGRMSSGSIVSSYSTATVSGEDSVGGLVGTSCGGCISSSYCAGAIRSEGSVGGLVGRGCVTVGMDVSSFWDIETSGVSHGGDMGLSIAQMKDVDTFQGAGWDLVGRNENGSCGFWVVLEGAYPSLTAFSGCPAEPNGSGTVDDPYILTDANDLGMVWSHPEAYYRLDADIDLSGMVWNSAVIPVFSGVFEGTGHVISNLNINGGGYLGLFGVCTSRAVVSHLCLEDVAVNGIGDYVGGLVGVNYGGCIQSCCSSGSICGNDYVGGLVGSNAGTIISSTYVGSIDGDIYVGGLVGLNKGLILSSRSDGSVSGMHSIGGLVGRNYSEPTGFGRGRTAASNSIDDCGGITSSYSSGNVNGYSSVGGLVGYNYLGTVIASYSNGLVSGDVDNPIGGLIGLNYEGKVLSSFWDMETSGLIQSDGGTGLTTIEMQDINTYLDAGWDFVGEMTNGTEDLWWMPESDYPRLWWEGF